MTLSNQAFQLTGRPASIYWFWGDDSMSLIRSAFEPSVNEVFANSSHLSKSTVGKPIRTVLRKASLTVPDSRSEWLISDAQGSYLWLLDGYYQQCEWIRESLGPMRAGLPGLLPQRLRDALVEHKPTILHIRLQDYLSSEARKSWGVLDRDYYIRALSVLQHELPHGLGAVWLVSDDLTGAQRLLRDFPVKVDPFHSEDFGLNALQKIAVMAMSEARIISTSTFSWWGAYLASESTRTVAPMYLHRNGQRQLAGAPGWKYVEASWEDGSF